MEQSPRQLLAKLQFSYNNAIHLQHTYHLINQFPMMFASYIQRKRKRKRKKERKRERERERERENFCGGDGRASTADSEVKWEHGCIYSFLYF